MERSFLDYAMSVITARALPDARDGLKPVHRRILYGMYEDGTAPRPQHQKSAPSVGDVMGKYHPHGDRRSTTRSPAWPRTSRCATRSSTATATSARPTPTTARPRPRYTEARLAPLAMQLLGEIDEDTVDFADTTTARTSEPTCCRRGSRTCSSTAAAASRSGMATNIPPHNLGEIIDATIHLLDNPDATVDDLMKFVQGPDFPTGALILGRRRDPRRVHAPVAARSRCAPSPRSRRASAASSASSSPRCRTRRRSR